MQENLGQALGHFWEFIKTPVQPEAASGDSRMNREVTCSYQHPETCAYALEACAETYPFAEINTVIIQIKTHHNGLVQGLNNIRHVIMESASYLKKVEKCVFVIGLDICLNFSLSKAACKSTCLDSVLNHFVQCGT